MPCDSEDTAGPPPSGVVAQFEADAKLAAMFGQDTAGIGLEWIPPPCLECLRLNDWFLGLECG